MPVRINSRAEVRSARSGGAAAPATSTGLLFGLPVPPAGTVQLPPGVSLCMIVKNEEKFLARCLQSVAGIVDEINVVDTGSTDRTVEIAQSFGARIEHREWRDDFAWARNEALAMATKRWILVLDADEELTDDSREHVRLMKTVPAHLVGLWVRCYNLADDYKGTGASSHALARLYPNNPRIRYRSPIHEFISLDQNITGLDCKPSRISIIHHGYLKDVVEDRDKGQRNLDIIRAATEREPNEPFHWYNLGVTALIMGNRPLAVEALERMYELVGMTPRGFVPVGLSTLAEAYGDDQPEKAMEAALQSLKRSPNFCNAHFSLGRALSNMKRYSEAREAFEAAIADGPYNALQFVCDDEVPIWKAHSEIGHTYAQEGNAEKALEWFEKGLANRPNVQPLRMNRARALEALKRYDEALEAFRGIYADYHDDASVTDFLNFLLRREMFGEALDVIGTSVDVVKPKLAVELLRTAATVTDRIGLSGAEVYLERALMLAPGNAAVLNDLERRYRERGDTAALERMHDRERNAPCLTEEDYARRAARFLAENTPEKALEIALEGLSHAPEFAKLLYSAGAACAQLGRKGEAMEYLERVRPSEPEVFHGATYLRALLLFECGRQTEALTAIETVLAVTPTHAEALVYRGKILEALGRLAEAEAALRLALQSGSTLDRQKAAAELGLFYMRRGDFEKAQRTAEEALTSA